MGADRRAHRSRGDIKDSINEKYTLKSLLHPLAHNHSNRFVRNTSTDVAMYRILDAENQAQRPLSVITDAMHGNPRESLGETHLTHRQKEAFKSSIISILQALSSAQEIEPNQYKNCLEFMEKDMVWDMGKGCDNAAFDDLAWVDRNDGMDKGEVQTRDMAVMQDMGQWQNVDCENFKPDISHCPIPDGT